MISKVFILKTWHLSIVSSLVFPPYYFFLYEQETDPKRGSSWLKLSAFLWSIWGLVKSLDFVSCIFSFMPLEVHLRLSMILWQNSLSPKAALRKLQKADIWQIIKDWRKKIEEQVLSKRGILNAIFLEMHLGARSW